MVKFLFIRVFVFSIILAAVTFIVDGNRIEIPVGILIGSLVSIYKIRIFARFLEYLTQDGNNTFMKSLFLNLFSQALALVILTIAVMMDIRLFFGIAAGLVSTAFVICLNGLTEKIGLTHNNWRNSDKKG